MCVWFSRFFPAGWPSNHAIHQKHQIASIHHKSTTIMVQSCNAALQLQAMKSVTFLPYFINHWEVTIQIPPHSAKAIFHIISQSCKTVTQHFAAVFWPPRTLKLFLSVYIQTEKQQMVASHDQWFIAACNNRMSNRHLISVLILLKKAMINLAAKSKQVSILRSKCSRDTFVRKNYNIHNPAKVSTRSGIAFKGYIVISTTSQIFLPSKL